MEDKRLMVAPPICANVVRSSWNGNWSGEYREKRRALAVHKKDGSKVLSVYVRFKYFVLRNGFAQKFLWFHVPALPPDVFHVPALPADVRRGLAAPSIEIEELGYAPGSGFAHKFAATGRTTGIAQTFY